MNATRLATAVLIALLPLAAAAETPISEDRPLAADARVEVNNMAGEIRIVGSDVPENQPLPPAASPFREPRSA